MLKIGDKVAHRIFTTKYALGRVLEVNEHGDVRVAWFTPDALPVGRSQWYRANVLREI